DDPGTADDIDLNAHDVVGRDEAAPRIDRFRVAGQFPHPALHHLAHDLIVDFQPVLAQTYRRFHRNDFARIRPWHPGRGGGFVRRDDLVLRNVTGFTRVICRSQRSRGKELDESSAFHSFPYEKLGAIDCLGLRKAFARSELKSIRPSCKPPQNVESIWLKLRRLRLRSKDLDPWKSKPN